MTLKSLLIATLIAMAAVTPPSSAATVNATGKVTNNVIFGSGNSNAAFTGVTVGGLELALRAKLRYNGSSACGGFGCAQNTFNYTGGNTYTFISALSHAPVNRSIFNFEWSINSNTNGSGAALNSLVYSIGVDTDPTFGVASQITYNPLSALSTGYYLGTNASGNGGAAFRVGGTGNLGAFSLAQNSVNLGFLPGAKLGSGQFRISLSAFNATTHALVASTAINVIVDAPAPIPLPAGLPLLGTAIGGLTVFRRRKTK